MKRILTIIAITACAAVLMNSCQTSSLEVKEGVPLTIQASVTPPAGTKTLYDYTDDKTLEGYWDEKEYITVVSFDESGITAVDEFVSIGERGRTRAEFSGTWHGNGKDRIICLYPSLDSYAGYSIYEGVTVGYKTIYIRELETPSSPLQHDDTGAVSDVDLMLGEVTVSGGVAHVNLKHLIAVFRITATLQSLPYLGEPYFMAQINTLRISVVNPTLQQDEWGPYHDPVFVTFSGLNVTTGSYTGEPYMLEKGPVDYFLVSAGPQSDFHMTGDDGKKPVTKTFYVPVRFDEDLKAGYELHLQFGGYYYDGAGPQVYTDVFPAGDKRITITETLPLENGKIYCIEVTI